MKIAFAGKGGVGKTTLAAWTADYLARQGKNVWLVDADTALSLGQAAGLAKEELPRPLIQRKDLIEERMGAGIIQLNPTVEDLPERLAVDIPGDGPGRQRLLVMGTVTNAGGGCACGANGLLKALLSHIVLERDEWVVVDLEAGVEHLGRGTVQGVDGLVVVTEASRRGLDTAASIGTMAMELGLENQALVLNQVPRGVGVEGVLAEGVSLALPSFPGLRDRQLNDTRVVGLPEQWAIDTGVERLLALLS
ncbi:ATP-binding protein [Desulfogranum mediterraneum]|uniref:ATP-binding protein n=1 Tax=Desulfogranum mediterraneum TaxID=160661 RepID=UPI0003F8646B|nr:ArsA-related P-loop ATPase [Desulfogranum mediterraneum]